MWSQTYIGHPNVLSTDRGSVFTSIEWENLTRANRIRCQMSKVEGHNDLGEGERYHSFLRIVFSKILLDQPHMDADYALGTAVKAVNDTAGPAGIFHPSSYSASCSVCRFDPYRYRTNRRG